MQISDANAIWSFELHLEQELMSNSNNNAACVKIKIISLLPANRVTRIVPAVRRKQMHGIRA